jgi:hypothetical protein
MPYLILLVLVAVVGLWLVRELVRTAVLVWRALVWTVKLLFRLLAALLNGAVWLVCFGQRTLERHAHRTSNRLD